MKKNEELQSVYPDLKILRIFELRTTCAILPNRFSFHCLKFGRLLYCTSSTPTVFYNSWETTFLSNRFTTLLQLFFDFSRYYILLPLEHFRVLKRAPKSFKKDAKMHICMREDRLLLSSFCRRESNILEHTYQMLSLGK